ncbi:MAG: oligoendopeptidase F [Clostridia bacterium]|nr:oligoendopeptidase F [Clostridia bacterium]
MVKKREEIDEKYKWDLSQYCNGENDFYERLKVVEKQLSCFKKFEGKLSDESVLFECLELECKIDNELSKLIVYVNLRMSENIANKAVNEMSEKGEFVVAKYFQATSFINVEVSKFSTKKLRNLQNQSKFKNYVRYFEGIVREKKHTLSKKEELLLSKLAPCFGGSSVCFDKFADVDLKFDKVKDSQGKLHELNQSNYGIYLENRDRKLRENAYLEMNGKFGQFINLLSANYINNVKEDCIMAKIRGYKSALSMAIYNEEASEDVYKMIIKKVRENVSLHHRYLEIKRQMLGLEKMKVFDIFAPIFNKDEKKFSYEEAVQMVKNATEVLGKEYVSLVDKAWKDRWVDVYPNENKESGGFSTSVYGANPVVQMNFEDNFESVMTLAHELGHSLHSYYSDRALPMQLSDYVIFVAEVTSRTNELLLLNYVLKNAKTKEERIYVYDQIMVLVRSSIFRTTMSAEFEEFAHAEFENDNPLTAELFNEKHKELTQFYNGNGVELLDETQYEWARLPHFYSSFYVYKYTVGLICAFNIVYKLFNEKGYVEKYLKFISSGGSADPISLLKIAECDLTDEKTFDNAFKMCENYIKMWEEDLKK